MSRVAKAYDVRADHYDMERVGNHAQAENLHVFTHLINGGYTDANVVEVCCGTGNLIDYLDEHIATDRYLGVDISPQMVSVAKAKHPDYSFSVNSLHRIPVLDATVEAIVAVFGGVDYLMTPLEIEEALGEFLRALKPGGKLFLQVWGGEVFRKRLFESRVEGQLVPRRQWTRAALLSFVTRAFEGARVWGMAGRVFRWLPRWTPVWFLRLYLWVEKRTMGKWRPERGRYMVIEATKPRESRKAANPVTAPES